MVWNGSNVVMNPVVPGFKARKIKEVSIIDETYYKQIVGSPMYITVVRPDIMFVVSFISRFMARPTKLHLQAVKRVLGYLKGHC